MTTRVRASKLCRRERFVKVSLTSKAIPTPKLLVKDHKKRKSDRNFPMRLIMPATNFTVAFSKHGYKGIKAVFEENNVIFDKQTNMMMNVHYPKHAAALQVAKLSPKNFPTLKDAVESEKNTKKQKKELRGSIDRRTSVLVSACSGKCQSTKL